MQGKELEELLSYLDSIINRTAVGEMNWSQVNPTTYAWRVQRGQSARLTLQRTPVGYAFHALDDSDMARMALTDNLAVVNQKLNALFNVVEKQRDRKSLDFLKSILPKG